MVYIERIVLQGFKSFKRKASIPFGRGFSCITGPNGSGKSNIGEAIVFVLGKSSSRSMRAKKGEELIFHGSKIKPASDYASVVLYLDNSGKKLPLADGVVTVGRRVNKNGVSTYRLNGKVVTRQQVVDVLVQAAVHPDGHNIIQQGDVNQIVEMRPEERRTIIDDIAGISDYEEKKQKALKEMERIEEKVREAEIVLQEKHVVMEKLQREKEAAQRYKEYEAYLEQLRAAIIWKEFSESKGGLEEYAKRSAEKEKLFSELGERVKAFDEKIAEAEVSLNKLTKEVISSDMYEVTKKIGELRGRIERFQDRIESNKREIERLEVFAQRLSDFGARGSALLQHLKFPGVHGSVSDLIKVPAEYATAVEVAAGGHLSDIVVDNLNTAVKCVKHLKENRLGRARFLPLDKVEMRGSRYLPKGAVDWVSNLIKFEGKYKSAVDYVFGTTACVKDIDRAKQLVSEGNKTRLVTLDGDLFEPSGAVTGGYFTKRAKTGGVDVSEYMRERKKFELENSELEERVEKMQKELNELAEQERKAGAFTFEKRRLELDEKLRKLRDERRQAMEERIKLQAETGRLSVMKAKFEATFDNYKLQWEELEKERLPKERREAIEKLAKHSVAKMKDLERQTIQNIHELGPVNLRALEDFDVLRKEFEEFREKVDKILEEKRSVEDALRKIEERRREAFMKTLNSVSKHFKDVYSKLVEGEASLELEDAENIESGLLIKATPPGKKLLSIDAMSGGEKTLTAFAFVFALLHHKETPFYILDEADATLDKVNSVRVSRLLKEYAKRSQFIIISHNDTIVREAERVYGVTMEDGESKILGVELPKEPVAAAAAVN